MQREGGATIMAVSFQHLEECACELKEVLKRISEEQAARRRLKEEFTNFQEEVVSLLEASPIIYLLVDSEMRIRKANSAALQRTGNTENELKGQHTLAFLGYSPDDEGGLPGATQLINAIRQTIEESKCSTDLSISLPCQCKGSYSSCNFIISTVPYSMDNENYALVAIHDVTVCNLASARASHDERIRALSTLASNIANEGNNAVQIVLGNISIARVHVEEKSEVNELLNEIESAALRWAELCTTLASLSCDDELPRKDIVIPAKLAVGAATRFRHRLGTSKCHIRLEGCSRAQRQMTANEKSLTKAIDAVLANAKDVTPPGGTISLAMDDVSLGDGELSPLPAGRYVTFAVHDEGPGIEPRELANIFDPLYTTKPHSRGLGLSVAYSILRRHEGTVTVSSTVGDGTTVKLYVPVLADTFEFTREAVARERLVERPQTHKGRILLMDDEPIIRSIAASMLKTMGWQVTTVSEGKEAIASYKAASERNEPYTVVILDLSVPAGLGGRETMRQLRAHYPNVVAIVSSGMVRDPVVTHCKNFGFDGSLPKPYTFDDLEKVLARVLSNRDKVDDILLS